MSDTDSSTADPDVIVIPTEVDDAPDIDAGDTTVIIETPDEPDDGDADDAVSDDILVRFGRIEAIVEDLAARFPATEATADLALEVAVDAEDTAIDAAEAGAEADAEIVEAVDEAIVETVEGAEVEESDERGEPDTVSTDAIAPVSARVHPMFRSLADWKNR